MQSHEAQGPVSIHPWAGSPSRRRCAKSSKSPSSQLPRPTPPEKSSPHAQCLLLFAGKMFAELAQVVIVISSSHGSHARASLPPVAEPGGGGGVVPKILSPQPVPFMSFINPAPSPGTPQCNSSVAMSPNPSRWPEHTDEFSQSAPTWSSAGRRARGEARVVTIVHTRRVLLQLVDHHEVGHCLEDTCAAVSPTKPFHVRPGPRGESNLLWFSCMKARASSSSAGSRRLKYLLQCLITLCSPPTARSVTSAFLRT